MVMKGGKATSEEAAKIPRAYYIMCSKNLTNLILITKTATQNYFSLMIKEPTSNLPQIPTKVKLKLKFYDSNENQFISKSV